MRDNGLSLILSEDTFAVCRLDAHHPIPDWVWSGAFSSVTRTEAELSVVCAQVNIPSGIQAEYGWRCLRVAGTLDFTLVGILASLVEPLAIAAVSVFALSTYDTDYLFVKETDLKKAIAVLKTAGHRIELSANADGTSS